MKKYFYLLLAAVALLTLSCDPEKMNPDNPEDPQRPEVPLLSAMAKSVMGKTPKEVDQLMKTYDFTKQTTQDQQVEYRDANNRPVTIAFNDDHAHVFRSIGLDRSVYTMGEWVEAGPYLLQCHHDLTVDYKWGLVQGSLTSNGWNAEAHNETDVAMAILQAAVYDTIPMGDVHFTVDYFTSLTAQGGAEAHFDVKFKDTKDVQIFFTYSYMEPQPAALMLLPMMAEQIMCKTPEEVENLMNGFGFTKSKTEENRIEFRDADNRPILIELNANNHASVLYSKGMDDSTYEFETLAEANEYMLQCHEYLMAMHDWGQVQGSIYGDNINEAYEELENTMAMWKSELIDKTPVGKALLHLDYYRKDAEAYGPNVGIYAEFVDGKDVKLTYAHFYDEAPVRPNYPNFGEIIAMIMSKSNIWEGAEVLIEQGYTEVPTEDYGTTLTNNNGFYIYVYEKDLLFQIGNWGYPMHFYFAEDAVEYIISCLPAIQGATPWLTTSVKVYSGTEPGFGNASYTAEASDLVEAINEVINGHHLSSSSYMRVSFSQTSDNRYDWAAVDIDLIKINNGQFDLQVSTYYQRR